MFVGIDVSTTHGFDCCVIDDARRVALVAKARDLAAVEPVLRALPSSTIFAVAAPSGPARGLLPGNDHRVAEHDVQRLGFSVHFTPSSPEDASAWMREGFRLFAALADIGFPLFRGGDASPGSAIEVYPRLSYVSVSGMRRGAGSKIDWSRRILRSRVHGLPRDAGQNALDAACAALTAWHFGQGTWVAYGDAAEGLIVAPRSATDLARPGATSADQLYLAIETSAPPRAITPSRATTFADRVVAITRQIPTGSVATFGDIARWAGKPAGARAVGTILKAHPYELPCHRVVNANGDPPPFPTDAVERLGAEGVAFNAGRVDLTACRWRGPS
ncbi:MAG: DUF429 domain-containing protein [Actinomycetota bacterium]